MNETLTRRNFVAGAALAGAGVAAAASLAGATSAQAQDALTAEGNPAWLGEAPEIAESDITETLETEVLICGFATGGVPCALSCAQNGSKTLVIERDAEESCQTMREDIGAMNSKLQLAAFEEFPEFKFEEKDAVEDIVRYANGFCNYDLIKMWAQRSGEAVDWVTDTIEATGKLVMEFEGGIGNQDGEGRDRAYATGHSPQKTEAAGEDDSYTAVMRQAAIDAGVEVRWSCPMVKLEQDESGRVTGAIAQDTTDGHYVRINASKGVVLATGGYSTNTDMMSALQPEIVDGRILCTMGSTDDGSGIKAGMWLGARKDPIGTSILFNRCCVMPDEVAGNGVVGRWFWFGEQPFLKVNLNGKRFCNESGPYDYMLHSTWSQPYHTYCDIWDSDAKAKAEQLNEVGCCRLFPFDNGAKNNIPFDVVWDNMNAKLIEDGYIQQADTIEELAEKLGIPADNLVKTVERQNENYDNGVDPDFGKDQHRLSAIRTAPFFGVRTSGYMLCTLDGITINEQFQAVRADGSAIEGLYVGGCDSGSYHAHTYPNMSTGNCCGRSVTFARMIGKALAAK